ncbi:MAG: hypothetical protein VX464_22260 [Pseudomonadota bacterium]|nr:hypothetical protein [Pseudomonadota bacterium]
MPKVLFAGAAKRWMVRLDSGPFDAEEETRGLDCFEFACALAKDKLNELNIKEIFESSIVGTKNIVSAFEVHYKSVAISVYRDGETFFIVSCVESKISAKSEQIPFVYVRSIA